MPSRVSELRFVTFVVLVTVRGAVPVAMVETSWVPVMVLLQAKAPVLLVTVQPVLPEPPPSSMLPVLVAPICTRPVPLPLSVRLVLVPPDAMASAPLPVMAVPDTVRPLTAVALSEPPVKVAPLTVDVQASAPVLLVRVQPVAPEPPPSKISPVLVLPICTCPVVPASTVKLVAAVVAATAAVAPVKLMVPLVVKLPVTLVVFCSSTVPTGLRTMLPLVVVWRVRLPAVRFSAAVMLVLARLSSAVVAKPLLFTTQSVHPPW